MYNRICELPKNERPYDKYLKYGVNSLSDSELLAVILKTGSNDMSSVDLARQVLLMPDNSFSLLALFRKSYEDLLEIKGIGQVKAITLKCLAELTVRLSTADYSDKPVFSSPYMIANYYMEKLRHLNQEEFIVLYLNSANMLIADKVVSIGSVSQTIVSAREVFIQALKYEAVNIILLHNHPGGNPTPSKEDIDCTKRLVETGNLLNISVLDHIIIGNRKYISFKEQQLL